MRKEEPGGRDMTSRDYFDKWDGVLEAGKITPKVVTKVFQSVSSYVLT